MATEIPCQYVVRGNSPFIHDEWLTSLLHDVWRVLPMDVTTTLAERIEGFSTTSEKVLGKASPIYEDCSLWSVILNSVALVEYPDNQVRFVIAHELGHVFACHIRAHHEDYEYYERDENEADALAETWGFPPPTARK